MSTNIEKKTLKNLANMDLGSQFAMHFPLRGTLLQALQLGIYNKVPGDGREHVVCDPLAVKIRAEDGRSVKCTDISPFINNLPFGRLEPENQ